jgi:hypothetical protein
MAVWTRIRPYLLGALALSAGGAGALYVNLIARVDPFESLHGVAPEALNPVDVEFRNVDLKEWKGTKLVTSAKVGAIQVGRDHQRYDLLGVTKGVYSGHEGKFQYSANHVTWLAAQGQFQAEGNVHVVGKDLDIYAPRFAYFKEIHKLTAPGPIAGSLDHGKIQAQNLTYDVSDDSHTCGPIHWEGQAVIDPAHPDKSGPTQSNDDSARPWDFDTPHEDTKKVGKHTITTCIDVKATDGASIVQTPHLTWDREADVTTCEGPVKYWSAKENLICDHLVLYRKDKHMVATGNVVMYLKPEDRQVLDDKMEIPPYRPIVPDDVARSHPPSPMVADQTGKKLDEDLRSTDSVKKYPATIRADKIVYYYAKGHRHADITGSPQAQQELPEGRWRMGWADHAAYDGEKEILYLYSRSKESRDARTKDSLGDDSTAFTFELSTKDGDDTSSGEYVKSHYISTDEEANAEAAKQAVKKKDVGKKPPPKSGAPPLSGPIGHGGA